MDGQEISCIIDNIMWGKSLTYISDSEGVSRLFILRSLTIKETNLVNYIYQREYQNCIENGVLCQKDIEDLYSSMGVWGDEQENIIKANEVKIKQLKLQIKNLEFMTIRKRQVEKHLEVVKKENIDLAQERSDLFCNSAEMRAEEFKRRFIVMFSVENENEERYWKTKEDFLSENDFELICKLAMSYYKNNLFDEKTLRAVARSPQWRCRWSAAKLVGDLFGGPVSEWSEMQNMIVYWSQYYDYIFENPDRPIEGIIENDSSCDAWVEEQSKKNKGSSGNKDKNMLGTKKATTTMNHGEQFIMVGAGDKEAIDRVQEMNPGVIRGKLRREYNEVKKRGKLTEFDLRKGEIIHEQNRKK